jgi:hypothetical protein
VEKLKRRVEETVVPLLVLETGIAYQEVSKPSLRSSVYSRYGAVWRRTITGNNNANSSQHLMKQKKKKSSLTWTVVANLI